MATVYDAAAIYYVRLFTISELIEQRLLCNERMD